MKSGKVRKIISDDNPSHAEAINLLDMSNAELSTRRFQLGDRPVIRWVKGDGLDDSVTKSAIAQATRLFGSDVDYCLCTNGISAERARNILEWASEPVEWWPVTADVNPELRDLLATVDCLPANYGYWWKWFPERVRIDAPEWILDGDMVITSKPEWFEKWTAGKDPLRVSQDDRFPPRFSWKRQGINGKKNKYGQYGRLIDKKSALYSGLISLPPKMKYMETFIEILTSHPLSPNHDGVNDMSEQGVVALAFQRLGAIPIPLHEFPFGRAFEKSTDFGITGDQGKVWGYHFGNSFRRSNHHFESLVKNKVVISLKKDASRDKYTWLAGGVGQWGIPGWGMSQEVHEFMMKNAKKFSGKKVLEIGTSRGRLAATLADLGCLVTTVDKEDRGATENLAGTGITVVVQEAKTFLTNSHEMYDLIIIDLHGNSPEIWSELAPLLIRTLARKGRMLINNARLNKISEWSEEIGVGELLNSLPTSWKTKIHKKPSPGIAVVRRGRART